MTFAITLLAGIFYVILGDIHQVHGS